MSYMSMYCAQIPEGIHMKFMPNSSNSMYFMLTVQGAGTTATFQLQKTYGKPLWQTRKFSVNQKKKTFQM